MTFKFNIDLEFLQRASAIALSGALCFASGAALAQDKAQKPAASSEKPYYVAVGGALSTLNDTAGTIANAPTPGSTVRTQSQLQDGPGAQVALGRSFGPYRVEGEIGYSHNTQNSYVSIAPPTGRITANVKDDATRYMVNAYRDFDLFRMKPYLGVGLGAADVNIDFFAPRAPFPTEPPRQLIKDRNTVVVYQLMAGTAIPITKRLALTVQYRWFDAGTIKGKDERGEQFTRDHRGGNLDIGLRLRF